MLFRLPAAALLAAWVASAQPAPGPAAPATPPPPPPGADTSDTVQLHRVVYVHQGQGENLIEQKKFVDQYAAPPKLFPDDSPSDPQYFPPPIQVDPQLLAKQRKAADREKNWMLLTPEEILGVNQKVEDPNDPDRDLSIEQRYVKRQEQMYYGANLLTNRAYNSNHLLEEDQTNSAGNFNSRYDSRDSRWMHGGLAGLMGYDRATATGTAGGPGNTGQESQSTTSLWGTPQPVDPVQAELKRKADMEQFQHMLSPVASSVAAAPKLSDFGSSALPTINPLTGDPNPPANAAQSVSLLKESIGRPAPLPAFIPDRKPVEEEHRRKPSPPPWLLKPGQTQ